MCGESYGRRKPWPTGIGSWETTRWSRFGAAALVGYLIVPKRKKIERVALDVSSQAAGNMASALKGQPGQATLVKAEKKSGLIGAAFGMLAPIAVRAVQGYALKYIENWIAQQQLAAMGPGHSAAHTPSEPRSRTINP